VVRGEKELNGESGYDAIEQTKNKTISSGIVLFW